VNQRYGASTRAAVLRFQTAHKLPATGAVDEASAAAVNHALIDKGALPTPPAQRRAWQATTGATRR